MVLSTAVQCAKDRQEALFRLRGKILACGDIKVGPVIARAQQLLLNSTQQECLKHSVKHVSIEQKNKFYLWKIVCHQMGPAGAICFGSLSGKFFASSQGQWGYSRSQGAPVEQLGHIVQHGDHSTRDY